MMKNGPIWYISWKYSNISYEREFECTLTHPRWRRWWELRRDKVVGFCHRIFGKGSASYSRHALFQHLRKIKTQLLCLNLSQLVLNLKEKVQPKRTNTRSAWLPRPVQSVPVVSVPSEPFWGSGCSSEAIKEEHLRRQYKIPNVVK